MWLKTDNDRLALRVENLQNLLKELQNGPSEGMNAFVEKIATQESVIQDMEQSRSTLEKEVARLKAVNEKYIKSQEDLCLQSKLKSFQQSQMELQKEAGNVRRLSLGNKELEQQVAHGVERVVVAERRISQLLFEMEQLEQQNLTLREENEDMLVELELARKGKDIKTGKLTVETSNSEAAITPLSRIPTISPFCLARMLEESRGSSIDLSKVWTSLDNISEAQTPSPAVWKETTGSKKGSLLNEYLWKESPKSGVSGYIRKVDVLDEYLYLCASAVKINFPMVKITNEELLDEARKLPFHRVYDFLRTKMELRLKKQEKLKKIQSESQRKSKIRKLFSWSSPLKKQIT